MTSTQSNSMGEEDVPLQRRDTDLVAERVGLPYSIVEPTIVSYRSVGIGVFGVAMRFAGMPLEKVALFMNSSQVSGKNQLRQAARLAFQDGVMAPYRVVGPASVTAWFLQYSVMGMAFQFFDHGLSKMLGVKPVYYGLELMQPPKDTREDAHYKAKKYFKTALSPVLAAALETYVSNRAEVQRFYGPQQFARIEQGLRLTPLARAAGPAFMPCCTRNLIMCQTTFVLTPTAYKLYFPQELKNPTSLFWFGLGMNVFIGNAVAITQQALWGRTLDYAAQNGKIHYRNIIQQGIQKEGMRAFFTGPKWFSRVLMNAPAQGLLPWFYNEILPIGEVPCLLAFKKLFYTPFLEGLYELQEELEDLSEDNMIKANTPRQQ